MADSFFITTAIDYTNGAPHIGHAYEKVLADVLSRYHRLKGDDVFFLTGVDQHGQKVQQSAEKQGVAPQEFVDGITAKFIALWKKLGVEYTGFDQEKPAGWAATTDPLHKECVRANLQMLWDDKDAASGQSRWLYKKTQRGYYSVRQEQFLTDKERGEDGEFGPEWGVVEERDEENFYFRLTAHPSLPIDPATGQPLDPKQWLLSFIKKRSDDGHPFVIPDFRVAELLNAVEKLEGDLCISRPAARLQWGIPFPESFGAGFVTYVWFDALVNYISFVPGHEVGGKDEGGRMKDEENSGCAEGSNPAAEGPPSSSFPLHPSSFAALWPPLHVIGKDIMIPAHGVYWPIMLKALGFSDEEMPTLLVHGWWNISGAKMSKSLGNVIDPDALADKYGAEAVRLYLIVAIKTGKDADFSEQNLVQLFNSVLANGLGNLLNRTLNMAQKYRSGKLAKREGLSLEKERSAADSIANVVLNYRANFDGYRELNDGTPENRDVTWPPFEPDAAFANALRIVHGANQLVDIEAPWKLAKDPAQADKLDAVLYTLAESLRIIAILLSPVLPQAAQGIFDQLNWKMDEQGQETRFRLADAVWGGLPDGHQLGAPTPLFPRIEVPKE